MEKNLGVDLILHILLLSINFIPFLSIIYIFVPIYSFFILFLSFHYSLHSNI